jgi:hypothetical protein
METTLLVLAAGMGSRYGGLKQVDPVGPAGETILDYSVFDAIGAGFSRVVFVIRRDFEEEFREKVGGRFEDQIDVGYVFQQINDLPGGFSVPEGRVKPWGTAHAIWCAREAVDGPFLAINADDFYGREAIAGVGGVLSKTASGSTEFCMAGYPLESTLSANGPVSRGVCSVSESGLLTGIREYTQIRRGAEGIINEADGKGFSGRENVSLNCWGFSPAVFTGLEDQFISFLRTRLNEEKSEFYIPSAVASLIDTGFATVKVLPVESRWFGVTYRDDRPAVVRALADLAAEGIYPSPLWG